MLTTIQLHGQTGSTAPLMHLQRQDEHGLFDQFVAHFEAIWENASEPILPDPNTYPSPHEQPGRYGPTRR